MEINQVLMNAIDHILEPSDESPEFKSQLSRLIINFIEDNYSNDDIIRVINLANCEEV